MNSSLSMPSKSRSGVSSQLGATDRVRTVFFFLKSEGGKVKGTVSIFSPKLEDISNYSTPWAQLKRNRTAHVVSDPHTSFYARLHRPWLLPIRYILSVHIFLSSNGVTFLGFRRIRGTGLGGAMHTTGVEDSLPHRICMITYVRWRRSCKPKRLQHSKRSWTSRDLGGLM